MEGKWYCTSYPNNLKKNNQKQKKVGPQHILQTGLLEFFNFSLVLNYPRGEGPRRGQFGGWWKALPPPPTPHSTTPSSCHALWELGRERSFILQDSEVLIAKAMAVNVPGVGRGRLGREGQVLSTLALPPHLAISMFRTKLWENNLGF